MQHPKQTRVPCEQHMKDEGGSSMVQQNQGDSEPEYTNVHKSQSHTPDEPTLIVLKVAPPLGLEKMDQRLKFFFVISHRQSSSVQVLETY